MTEKPETGRVTAAEALAKALALKEKEKKPTK